MASEVSIVVRVRDMATRFLRGIGREAQKLGKGLGFGGPLSGIGKGGALFAMGMAFRSISQYAREMKDNADISAELRRSVDAINVVNNSAAGVGNTIRGWGASALAGFYRGVFRVKAMLRGMSWAESGAAADVALTDYDGQAEAAKLLADRMRAVADAKADYAAEQKGEEETLKLLESRQASIQAEIAKTAKVSKERVDLEEKLLSIAQKIDKTKESIAKKEEQAAEAARKAYDAAQERDAKSAQENFDRRAPLVEKLRKAATSPAARREMRNELREQEREQRRLQKITERAEWKTRMSEMPGNSNRRRFKLTKREAMAMEANRLDQQDDAMAKSLKNVDENTRKMLEALQENLQLK